MTLVFCLCVALGLALWLPGLTFRLRPHNALETANPALDIRDHLAGPLISEGVIYGPMGRVASRFVADMQGAWQSNEGELNEAFRFASGQTQTRTWRLKIASDGTVTGIAHDILGPAKGWQSGAALCLTYRIKLAPEEGGHVLNVTDWMYLMENGTIMNHSQMRKFGVKVAELIATIRPVQIA